MGRHGEPQMQIGSTGRHAAAGAAHQEALLNQERLDDILERAALLADRGGEAVDAYRSAVEFLDDRAQHLAVQRIKSLVIDVQHPQRGDRDGLIDPAIAALVMLDIDHQGFDALDRKVLRTVIEKSDGGPVGIDSIAAAIGEERGTIEDVIEPFLIQQGFLIRTARGRMATRTAYLHLGIDVPAHASATLPMFEEGS